MFHSRYVLSNGSNTKNTFNQSLNTTDSVTFNNLTVNGTSTTINSTNLSVADTLIVCGSGNVADTLDLGLLCEYTNSITSTTNWAGLIRDGATKGFYLVENLVTQTDPVSLSDLAKLNVSDIVSVTGSFSGSINNIDDRFRIGHNSGNWASMDTVSRLYLNMYTDNTYGTQTAADLMLTDASDAVKIELYAGANYPSYINAGKFGIGTATPQGKMDIEYSTSADGAYAGLNIVNSSTGGCGIRFRKFMTNDWQVFVSADGTGRKMKIGVPGLDVMIMNNNESTTTNKGCVGINTDPSRRLHVDDSSYQLRLSNGLSYAEFNVLSGGHTLNIYNGTTLTLSFDTSNAYIYKPIHFMNSLYLKSPFSMYYESTVTLSLTGACINSTLSLIVHYIITGNSVNMHWVGVTSSNPGTASSALTASAALPSYIIPVRSVAGVCYVVDNGTFTMGSIHINTSGIVSVNVNYSMLYMTNTSTCGVHDGSLSYLLT